MWYPGTEGLKLLMVQPLNRRLEPAGPLQVAADTVHAGPGDLCVMVRSREASLTLPDVKFVPVDLALVGVVDDPDACVISVIVGIVDSASISWPARADQLNSFS